MNTNMQDVEKLFRAEFGTLAGKFTVMDLPLEEARGSKVGRGAGVYVWWRPDSGVIKVGKSFKDSRRRAFDHFRDDTAGTFVERADHPSTHLFLFNAPSPADSHWIAALEIFFERKLSPVIPARKIG